MYPRLDLNPCFSRFYLLCARITGILLYPVYVVLEMKSGASYMLSRHSTNRAMPQLSFSVLSLGL